MPRKPIGSYLSSAMSVVVSPLGIAVTILVANISSKQRQVYLVGFTVALLALLVGAVTWLFVADEIGRRGWQRLQARWNGLDCRHRRWGTRLVATFGMAIFRMAVKRMFSPHFLIVVVTMVIAAIWYTYMRLVHGELDDLGPIVRLLWPSLILWALLIVLMEFAAGFGSRRVLSQPCTRVMSEISDALDNYIEVTTGTREEWNRVIERSKQQLRITAVNAYQLIEQWPAATPRITKQLESAPELKVEMVVADPLSRCIKRRDTLINGRLLEYYVRRFVKTILWWQALPVPIQDRVTVRMYASAPRYRIVCGDEAAVVQLYRRLDHGWADTARLLYRVHRTADFVEGKSFTRRDLPQPSESLYQHFSEILQGLVDESEVVRKLNEWGIHRLHRLARTCGVRRNHAGKLPDNPGQVCLSICESLELSTEWRAALDASQQSQIDRDSGDDGVCTDRDLSAEGDECCKH
jgi:hypothetical protein